jgi:uncharacterized protein (UPF0261 family)
MDEAVKHLGERGEVIRLDAHINDPICADTAVASLLAILQADGAALARAAEA